VTSTETHSPPDLPAFDHRGGAVRTLRSPYDGAELGTIPVCDERDVDRVVQAAAAAMGRPLPTWQRAEILDMAATGLRSERERFARIVASEAAKPLRTARIEVDRAAATFEFAAAASRTLAGEVVPVDASPAGAGKVAFTLRVPVGVIGAIAPFNFPLNLVAHKVAPAIAAGCPVVVKPADQTPLSSIALMRLLTETCGLPPGWISVVTGRGSVVGEALVDHRDVAMIAFTGSPEVGWRIRSRAPRKRVALELGNNAPVIIEPDGDWRRAARLIRIAGFSHAGQSCISTQRVYVHETVRTPFTEALVEEVSTLVVGDPLDEATDVSSLISADERNRVAAWIDEACTAGARIAVGGTIEGSVLEPTVLIDVDADMKVSKHEVFGPVVGIQSYTDYDDALARANDTIYGLQAAVFTADISKALRAARTLDFGGVIVNDVPTWRADNQPYGGVRDSGNTREGPAYSIREMTEARLVVIDDGEASA
jgi:acyl-CoA reductase-like NAD-dependent aldehyde dehydrogenase